MAPHAQSTVPQSASAPEITADVVVIGGGPVGENVAQYAIEGTDQTAVLIEGELLGGECSYYACMPSKALLRPLAVADAAAHLDGVSTPEVDTASLLARRDTWVSQYDDTGQVEWAEGAGMRVVRGHGRIVGEREVRVEDPDGGPPTLVHATRAVVIATGSQAVVPDALQPLSPWTSRDATGVQEIPGELLIVGGGVVAVEAATWMAALGSHITLLVRGDALLRGMEPFAGEHVLGALTALGVTVQLGTSAVSAERADARDSGLGRIHGGRVTLQVEDAQGRREVTGDEILVATGRTPRLADVGLETIGLSSEDITGAQAPTSDDATGAPLPSWLHAVGDASGEAPLTHWGKYRARVIGQAIRAGVTGEALEPVPETVPVPQVVFTDPQVTSVGLTAEQAREAGHDVVTSQVPFGGAAGSALLRDDVSGTAQLVVDRGTATLIGATFVGPEASELIHAATIAIVGQVPVHVLRHAVPSYPTSSELWLRLLEELPTELRTT
ncbi:dihydrolipoyl dehydrogenase family protein [Brachybacterium alimentarium]|uniref:Pyridine nucleotide-disulfide oxidoreductase n=1 Tax=Brachybacterium alimentarium TaxID=47845 RepID=A0A2A3YHG2_9MICO|nr:NAD(P)/FAD-dependent oxidoreductase [Brachybacterium alimentarium]PCC38545.1 pyridine nucleotide-disulfide oxidoreductase [Brachybacterium alimentarium]RCS87853.1 NAD(P)/FAD-dependent oxidoreductase [Brachybacterium alimentarium]